MVFQYHQGIDDVFADVLPPMLLGVPIGEKGIDLRFTQLQRHRNGGQIDRLGRGHRKFRPRGGGDGVVGRARKSPASFCNMLLAA